MMRLQPDGEMLSGPIEVNADEGLTETGFIASELPPELQKAHEANRRLKNEGGKGDGVSGIVNGEILTVKETLALAIARDMIDDAQRRHRKPLSELNMLELREGIDERVRGRAVTSGEVMQEIGRLQNFEKYKDRVRRR